MGAGIDYALFVVTRHASSSARAWGVAEAAGRANATAGHAVVFAGGTVLVASLGRWLMGLPVVGAMGLPPRSWWRSWWPPPSSCFPPC